MRQATHSAHEDQSNPPAGRRYWTRINRPDGTVFDNPAQSAEHAIREARATSRDVRGDVDAFDEATVLATFREGKQSYVREA